LPEHLSASFPGRTLLMTLLNILLILALLTLLFPMSMQGSYLFSRENFNGNSA
jgi:hypothetical protein